MKYFAGIAVLILSVLFLFGCTTPAICGNGICETNESSYSCSSDCGAPITAQSAIQNGLDSVKMGGSIITQQFVLQPGEVLKSGYFEGFDEHSIILDAEYPLNSIVQISTDNYSSYLKYSGSNSINASAKVICESTGTNLNFSPIYEEIAGNLTAGINPETLCGLEGLYQPCCLVMIQRK
ncbi:MAG: hypothetical protein AABW59_03360 [archaeon]